MGRGAVRYGRLAAVPPPVGCVSLLFILVHPALLFVADDEYLELLEVTEAPLLAKMGVTSAVALLIMVALSVWK